MSLITTRDHLEALLDTSMLARSIRSLLTLTLVCVVATSTSIAQRPLEDVIWVASPTGGSLEAFQSCGLPVRSLTSPQPATSRIVRDPEGSLVLLAQGATSLTVVNRQGGNPTVVPMNNTIIDLAFAADRTKNEVVQSSTGQRYLKEYDCSWTHLRTTPVAPSAARIAIASSGRVWIAHNSTPGLVSMFEPATGVLSQVPLAPRTIASPTRITTDRFGNCWVVGPNSNDVVRITGSAVVAFPAQGATGFSGLAIDRNDTVWVCDPNTNLLLALSQSGSVLASAPIAANPLDLQVDNTGRVFVLHGAPLQELRRYGPSGALELRMPVSAGVIALDDSGFHFAAVVDPLGDDDLDGVTNSAETTGSAGPFSPTSPFDIDSAYLVAILTTGNAAPGGTVSILLRPSPIAAVLVGFLRQVPPIIVPGFGGGLAVNTTVSTAILALGGTAVFVSIPPNPALIGVNLFCQSVELFAAPAFSNLDCLRVSQ